MRSQSATVNPDLNRIVRPYDGYFAPWPVQAFKASAIPSFCPHY